MTESRRYLGTLGRFVPLSFPVSEFLVEKTGVAGFEPAILSSRTRRGPNCGVDCRSILIRQLEINAAHVDQPRRLPIQDMPPQSPLD
jgi:hypothetical protein